MKKFYAMLLCVIVAASSMSFSAKNWRAIVDVGFGYMMLSNKEVAMNETISRDGVDKCTIIQPLISAGYQHNRLFLGGGLGCNLDTPGFASSLPLFAHIRYDFFKNDPKLFSPFVSFRAGYCVSLNTRWYDGGAFVNPTIGIRKGLSATLGLNLSVSYSLLGKGIYGEGVFEDYKANLSAITASIGLDF